MLEHEGVEYARVTEVLQPWTSFGHIDPGVLRRKAELGTAVHEAIYDYLMGDAPVLPVAGYGYLDSFKQWKDALNPEYVLMEQRLYDNELMLTGAIDALVKMPYEDLPVLVDYKTSAQESPTVWPMQAHLYQHLLKVNDRPTADRFLFLRLNKDGKPPKVHIYKWDEYTLEVCLQAVRTFWEKKSLHVDNNQE